MDKVIAARAEARAALWTEATPFLTIVAVLCWAVATVGWALRYGRWFGQPRSDGRPG